MQRVALAIRRKRFGSRSPEAAASLNELGLTFMASGKLSEAEQVNREALEIRMRRFGNESADVATSQNNLAHVYTQMGRLTQAEALAREALATRQRLFGNPSVEVADSLRNLAVILGDKRQWAEAEAMAREVLEMRRKLLGPEHPWWLQQSTMLPGPQAPMGSKRRRKPWNGKPWRCGKSFFHRNTRMWPLLSTLSAIACGSEGT